MTKHPYKFTVIHGESGSHGLIMADGPIQVAKLVEGTPADGLIMAAAPELLAVLEELVEDASLAPYTDRKIQEKAYAVIRKAKGEA
jgi:hypothetical protein